MKKLNIETTLGTYSISSQPYFNKYSSSKQQDVPNSKIAFRQTLTLPLYPGMKNSGVKLVTNALLDTLDKNFKNY
jgi:dTDP-4-amino-4,6-dideoxygalactose transaminase